MGEAIFLSWVVGSVSLLAWAAYALRREKLRREESDRRAKKLAEDMIISFNERRLDIRTENKSRCTCFDHLPPEQQWGRLGPPCRCGYMKVTC